LNSNSSAQTQPRAPSTTTAEARYPRDPRENAFYKWYAANHSNPYFNVATNTVTNTTSDAGQGTKTEPRDPTVKLERKSALRKASGGTTAPSAPSVSFRVPISSPATSTPPATNSKTQANPEVKPKSRSSDDLKTAVEFLKSQFISAQALGAEKAREEKVKALREQKEKARQALKQKEEERQRKEKEAEEAAREQAQLIRRYDTLASLTSIRSDFLAVQEAASNPPTPSAQGETSLSPSRDSSVDTSPTFAKAGLNRSTKAHEENLFRLLERLDTVDSDGDDVIRFVRRSLVKEVEGALEGLEKEAVLPAEVDAVEVDHPVNEVEAKVNTEHAEEDNTRLEVGLGSYEYEDLVSASSSEVGDEIQRPATAPPVLEQGTQTDAIVGENVNFEVEGKDEAAAVEANTVEVTEVNETSLPLENTSDKVNHTEDITSQDEAEAPAPTEVFDPQPQPEEVPHTFPPAASNFSPIASSSSSSASEAVSDNEAEPEDSPLSYSHQVLTDTDVGSDVVVLTDESSDEAEAEAEDALEEGEKRDPISEVGQFEFL